jgi:hypothetical protein
MINQIYVSIARENENSYWAFKKYCTHNKFKMEKVGEINLVDLGNPSFSESETLYRIEKTPS